MSAQVFESVCMHLPVWIFGWLSDEASLFVTNKHSEKQKEPRVESIFSGRKRLGSAMCSCPPVSRAQATVNSFDLRSCEARLTLSLESHMCMRSWVCFVGLFRLKSNWNSNVISANGAGNRYYCFFFFSSVPRIADRSCSFIDDLCELDIARSLSIIEFQPRRLAAQWKPPFSQ